MLITVGIRERAIPLMIGSKFSPFLIPLYMHFLICSSYKCRCMDGFRGEFCEFDKSMCLDDYCLTKRCPDEARCSKVYSDGFCDSECNTASCGWDGGDCIARPNVLSDDLVLTLITDPRHFVEHVAPKLLMVVSQLLHVSAQYQLDKDGFRMIYEWSSLTGQGPLLQMKSSPEIPRHKRHIKEQNGVKIYLRLDTSVCEQLNPLNEILNVDSVAVNGNEACPTSAKSAAKVIAADSSQQVCFFKNCFAKI